MSKYEIKLASYQGSVEKYYFAVLGLLNDFGFKSIKTKDTFTSSITSSFWGSIEQRRTQQQEKASQFLATIANMIKSLFQIIRDLRIMDERLQYYNEAKNGPDKKSAEIALKGIWIDMVEGAGKNPSSVYGLATQVGFTTLPDLFFDMCPKDTKEINKMMNDLNENGINKKLTEILRRKLFQYMEWRDKTREEMNTSRKFHLAYLRQHFNTIRIYLNWVKPYLKNVKKLEQQGTRQHHLIEMADTAISDIELFAYSKDFDKFKKYMPVINVTFEYTTVPELVYQQEYQRGPIHVGVTRIVFEGKTMLIEEVREKFRQDMLKDLDILKDMFASMDAIGDDLIIYLKQAEERDPEGVLGRKLESSKVKTPVDIKKLFGPFTDIGKGFKMLFGSFKPTKKKEFKKMSITYDLPEDIQKMWENRKKHAQSKRRSNFKSREEFENDKLFKTYITQSKSKNTKEEENEYAKVKGMVNKKEDLVWKVYDTLKKSLGNVRW
jgi:hypothetical protein